MDCGRVAVKRTRTRRVAKLCLRPTPPIKIERTCVLNRTGQQGNVYQAHQQGKWNPQSSAYGRFWVDVPSGERKRRTVSLGLCCSEVHRRFSGRRGGRSNPSASVELRIHATALGRQGEAESSHDHGSRNIRHANHPEGTRCRLGSAGGRNKSTNW